MTQKIWRYLINFGKLDKRQVYTLSSEDDQCEIDHSGAKISYEPIDAVLDEFNFEIGHLFGCFSVQIQGFCVF